MEGTIGADEPKMRSKRIVVKMKMSRKRGGTANSIAKKSVNFSTSRKICRKRNNLLPIANRKPSLQLPRITTTTAYGLPAFQYRTKSSQSDATPERKNGNRNSTSHEVNNSSSFYRHEDVQDEEEIPSDTLMAIHSLVQSDQGLHVPITNNGSVQVVLENQIYSIFDENHASNVNSELLELIQNNKVQRMYCQDMSSTAFILTDHYVRAVWDAHAHQDHSSSGATAVSAFSEEIISWFLSNLQYWTRTTISESYLEDRWGGNNEISICSKTEINLKDAVHYLLTAQFLIRDSKQHLGSVGKEASYFLWLPQWGIALKTWNEARQQLLMLLAQRKEMSKANVLQKNRHSHISTDFLLNELLYKEKIRIVDRPFGSFVQLVKG
mmetsp:Transcript_18364/g.37678  ORF Transcript_18364/g.37678 Transcript_18364/m.37678 type:complete len:381 (-) Transcript_18364:55-1197(-)